MMVPTAELSVCRGFHHLSASSDKHRIKKKEKRAKVNLIRSRCVKLKWVFLSKVDQISLCQTLFSLIFHFQGPKGYKGDKGERVNI